MKKRVLYLIEEVKDELIELSEYIYNNPELGYEEVKSSRAHIELLRKYGFKVEEKYLGIKTAFKGEFDSLKPGPTIAYLAEYDALPQIGHGCGHNLLGTTSTGAGIVLSKLISELGGKIIVFGTPAEETSGAKVQMVEKGAFNDVDVAMLVHPGDEHYKSGSSLAMEAIQFTFRGKSSHAAAYPEKGINALDAAINTFNNINSLREHIRTDARIHGIIVEGGKAANIVPDLAIAQFYVRATTKKYLKILRERVINCAKGASLAAGTQLEITNYEASYDNLVTNQTLSELYSKRLKDMGVEKIYESRESYGSLDMGNVSHVCPSIHPYFKISEKEIVAHTREFAMETITEFAYENMCKTIGALVLTAIDIIQDKQLLSKIKKEFETTEK
ncbi:M20 family metallopeptidase [Caldisalinibacter kiritimatiensis]|uniref:Peptidase M20 domain-containing protein 2 n=1 Tax=Caldisalinibacter kiritimatiensis TaxID=1304284 RepID=R1CSH7_9FIRM|nr:M20 family metallopeptidase [Caldisalinibacter kiritimatiensis]EOD01611.1 N-acyl-L-amino acid amidohydrolase [Caldisalinibacter kiritimatiensis]